MIFKKLYILLLLCFLSMNLLAERMAVTKQEKELLESVSENYTELSEYLISKGVAVDITDDLGRSLLMHAIQNKNKKLIKLLLEQGADVNYQSMKYSIEARPRFVIDYAIASGDTTIMNLLVDKGAKLELEGKGQESRVVTAFKANNLTVVQYLLDRGAKISNDAIRILLLREMLNSTNSFYVYPVNFWKVKIWDDYGFSIDANSLLSSISLKSIKARKKVVRYISKYKQWLNVANTLSAREKGKRKILQHNGLNVDKPLYTVKPTLEELAILEEQQKEHDYIIVWTVVGIVLALMIIVFYYRKKLQSWGHAVFSKKTVVPPPPSSNNSTSSSSASSRQKPISPQTTGRVDVTRSAEKKEVIREPRLHQLPISGRGWDIDDTVAIEVNYLTIEDMINPIRMQNEHERAVREMIWYIRRLEKRFESDTTLKKLDDDDLLAKLNMLWLRIDAVNVRSIYKRSLYVLVEYYSESDQNLQKFLNLISKSE